MSNYKIENNTKQKWSRKGVPVVGIGASAGGLEALKSFFSKVTKKSGLVYIVVIHTSPKQPSMMAELLQKVTPATVLNPKDGQQIEPNHIYIAPPDKEISLFKGKIQLMDTVKTPVPLPIDCFFRSLALDQGENAAGIILSGMGSDGTIGIKEIKANNGLIFVQSDETAEFTAMPRSAINTGFADAVLSPKDMPEKLIQYFSNPATTIDLDSTTTTAMEKKWLNKIFAILRSRVGHDFSDYKLNTILRRIGRRMGLNHIKKHDTYVRFLRENPSEVDALFRDLLIGVTSFFRDPESFETLFAHVLPELFSNLKNDHTFRVWVPGCSTGEEVYSLAILLHEYLERKSEKIDLQLFGTDIDNKAIDRAREGVFPETIASEVSEERLKKYFTKEGDSYRIKKNIRDCVVFSVQNVIKDPPFSRLHLLCCRNLLIYLETEAQKRLIPLFHYTLMPDGVLMLGSSESIGGFGSLFKALDKKWKIFGRQEIPQALRQLVDFPSGSPHPDSRMEIRQTNGEIKKVDINRLTQQVVIDQFAPTAILISAKGDILNVQGRTGKYLETPSGPPTNNILDMAREGLRIELSSALRAANSSDTKVTRKRLSVRTNGDSQLLDLHIYPLRKPPELAGRLLVVFEDMDTISINSESEPDLSSLSKQEAIRIAELEKKLQINRESHQITIEELESSNEELKSTNEELQSSNEEMQSTNEELESSKEELQSLNEELQTVNAELQSKVEELSAAHDDLHNLLNSTEIATIFVDNHLNVRRFTTEATKIINLIKTDIGRPLKHVVSNLKHDELISDISEVIDRLNPCTTEVQTHSGHWYNMRVMPYRTIDNRIDGAVLTFSSINEQKNAQNILKSAILESEQSKELVSALFDLLPDPMVVLDKDCRIVIGNNGFFKLTKMDPKVVFGADFLSIGLDILKMEKLKSKLNTALKDNINFTTEPFGSKLSEGKSNYIIDAKIIKKEKKFPYRILLRFLKER